MSRLRIHDLNKSREDIKLERMREFANLPAEEKMRRMFNLIALSRLVGGVQAAKKPQGKGIIITKEHKQDGLSK